ncbi:MAG: hypothetical protein ACXQTV_02660 [Candidatus Hecatellaceae archaeon]
MSEAITKHGKHKSIQSLTPKNIPSHPYNLIRSRKLNIPVEGLKIEG